MEDLVDLDSRDGRTLNRAQENSSEGIADGLSVTALKRFQYKLCVFVRQI